jgi:transposase-like protein
VRQLANISKYGIWKIKRIKNFWLNKLPEPISLNSKHIKYLIFDGTYFKHTNCLMVVADNSNDQIIANRYCIRENYSTAKEIFNELLSKQVDPKAITIDGNTSVILAIKKVWPNIIIQRCLVHVQRQGLSWLRRNPKNQAAKDLRKLLLKVTNINSYEEKQMFINIFHNWERRYGNFVLLLPSSDKVYSDLQRTRSLVIHAMPDMFHYLEDSNIASTTNKVEGYFSRLKDIYRQHRGMSKSKRSNYFNWYIYFKNYN